MSLTFQVIDWCVYQDYKNKKSIIQIFGKTLNGESVMIEVDDYKPCFYTTADKQTINKLCKDNIEVIEKNINSQKCFIEEALKNAKLQGIKIVV